MLLPKHNNGQRFNNVKWLYGYDRDIESTDKLLKLCGVSAKTKMYLVPFFFYIQC